MSYEATFRKKSNGEELGYFRCSMSGYSVAFGLLDVIEAPEDWYQGCSFPFVTKEMDKVSIEKAIKYAESKGPDYYSGDEPCYYVKDVLQEVYNSLSDEDEVEVFLF